MSEFRTDVFKRASLCRNFEKKVFDLIRAGTFKFPIYLSAGQEFTAATLAEEFHRKREEPNIFIQHRGHSTYLSFDAPVDQLADELLGLRTGCANGMGGSASIQSREKKIFGHDGLMGSQVPIAVGHCYSTKHPTVVFMGDASAEEDYSLGALGWAATKNLPILFVVEDNNLSILTEKKVRRSWEMHDVAMSFGMKGMNIDDNPMTIRDALDQAFDGPMLLNVNTHRKFWHAGAGIDDESIFDRYESEMSIIGDEAKEIDQQNKQRIERIWQERLERL
jgi:TPP-dependent pyruvate/acetoin dehydrogenase alpha subunit